MCQTNVNVMSLLKYFLITLSVFTAAFSSTSVALENNNQLTFIFGGEMPDITDPVSGRYPELKQLIESQRMINSKTFFLFGGGVIGPSAMSNLDRGSHIIDLLNSLEPDAMGVAKKEFSYFEDELSLRSYEAAFPIVSSNLTDSRTNTILDGLAKYAVIRKGDTSVGFISVTHKRLIDEYLLKNVTLESPEEAVIALSSKLRKEGADLIVLHYFNVLDFVPELLAQKHIDLAFVSNSRLRPDEVADADTVAGLVSFSQPGQAIVVSYQLDEEKPVQSFERISLSTLSPNLSIQNQMNAYKMRLDRLLDDRIGYWANAMNTRRESVRMRENAFANYVVDTMREFTKADVALINGGGIRGDKNYALNEEITRRTIATELPYRSTLKVITLSGQQLREAIEFGLSGLDDQKGPFPQVSGMRFVFNSEKPVGSRVVSIKVGTKPLVLEKTYRLVTSDYLVDGGDGYTVLTQGQSDTSQHLDNTILISDLVLRKVRLDGKLESALDGRIVNIAEQANDDL